MASNLMFVHFTPLKVTEVHVPSTTVREKFWNFRAESLSINRPAVAKL